MTRAVFALLLILVAAPHGVALALQNTAPQQSTSGHAPNSQSGADPTVAEPPPAGDPPAESETEADADESFQFTLEPLGEDHGIPLAIMGILVVFMALILVALFIVALPRIMEWLDRMHPEQKPAVAALANDELSEETVAVIAAAVAAVLDRPHRVVHVRGLTPEDLGWSLKGRLSHHASHSLRRGRQ